MQALQQVNLIAGKGLAGDRYNYEVHTGTYSASFIDEPGKNCTVVSADAVEKQMAATGMKPFEGGLGALRRNLVVRGLSGDELNDMVGHEVRVVRRGCSCTAGRCPASTARPSASGPA
tara:strand:- start:232 stop:585 length:354 start_codon:yes stop_codon:yes gene_type:complete